MAGNVERQPAVEIGGTGAAEETLLTACFVGGDQEFSHQLSGGPVGKSVVQRYPPEVILLEGGGRALQQESTNGIHAGGGVASDVKRHTAVSALFGHRAVRIGPNEPHQRNLGRVEHARLVQRQYGTRSMSVEKARRRMPGFGLVRLRLAQLHHQIPVLRGNGAKQRIGASRFDNAAPARSTAAGAGFAEASADGAQSGAGAGNAFVAHVHYRLGGSVFYFGRHGRAFEEVGHFGAD